MSDLSRRRFLASTAAAAGLAPFVAACGGGGPERASQCAGYGALSTAELQQRQALAYVDDSPKLGQVCTTCKLYNQPTADDGCGGCQLFAGPVVPQGWCTAWVATG